MNKNKQTLLMVLGILGLIVITAGVTYAFFSYTKQGTTENTVTTGTITFLYTEIDQVGAGISLTNAFPISDEQGKALTGDNEVFDFKITSNTPSNTNIPYEITARKKIVENMLDEEAVRIYLTKNNGTEEEVLLDNYSNLTQTSKVSKDKYIEKTLHTDKVPANSTNYEQAYRLRMWVDEDIDFSPVKDEEGNDTYPYNNKEFTVTVNVYANAKVVTEEDINNENNTNISLISIDDIEATKVQNNEYDYKIGLAEGTTETTINVETSNPQSTVQIEKIDSLAYKSSNVKRLSTDKTLQLTDGNNYFKITVISENKKTEKEYIINIMVAMPLSKQIFNNYKVLEATPNLDTYFSNSTDKSGLYKSTATNSGDPTYYFRGNVDNYVEFAGFTWRIVRINEDGTIRLIMEEGINDNTIYMFNTNYEQVKYMYYSNSGETGAKYHLDNWYSEKIASNVNYSSQVAVGNYFCEQARVADTTGHVLYGPAGMQTYDVYKPDFTCNSDGNGKGIVNASIGLITYDEAAYAGGYLLKDITGDNNIYLYPNRTWIMSPAGGMNDEARVWCLTNKGLISYAAPNAYTTVSLRPVINLKTSVNAVGNGTITSPWEVFLEK